MPARILSRCRLTPLALLIGTAFALSQPVHAKTLHVTTCADNGSNGSLRSVIARAQDGDTVDLTTLQCAVITEGSGPFVINQNHLTIRGVGPKTVINGYPAQGPIFAHTGNGRLTLEYLSLQNGLKYVTGPDDALGGCVFSSSDVELFDVQLSRCEAVYSSTKHAGNAKGGAIYAVGDVTLVESTITYGDAFVDFGTHALSGAASGGAIYAGGGLLMRDSQIIASETRATGSHARSFGGAVQAASVSCKYSTISRGGASNSRGDAYGGGIATTGNAYLLDDAIDDNKADEGAGLDFRGAGSSAEILQSTIASNTAYHAGGGIATRAGLTVTSSTIAYNRSMVSANGEASHSSARTRSISKARSLRTTGPQPMSTSPRCRVRSSRPEQTISCARRATSRCRRALSPGIRGSGTSVITAVRRRRFPCTPTVPRSTRATTSPISNTISAARDIRASCSARPISERSNRCIRRRDAGRHAAACVVAWRSGTRVTRSRRMRSRLPREHSRRRCVRSRWASPVFDNSSALRRVARAPSFRMSRPGLLRRTHR